MSAHTHTSYVDGCYRCELNKDEVAWADSVCANCLNPLDAKRALWWCSEGDAITICCSEGCAQEYENGRPNDA